MSARTVTVLEVDQDLQTARHATRGILAAASHLPTAAAAALRARIEKVAATAIAHAAEVDRDSQFPQKRLRRRAPNAFSVSWYLVNSAATELASPKSRMSVTRSAAPVRRPRWSMRCTRPRSPASCDTGKAAPGISSCCAVSPANSCCSHLRPPKGRAAATCAIVPRRSSAKGRASA